LDTKNRPPVYGSGVAPTTAIPFGSKKKFTGYPSCWKIKLFHLLTYLEIKGKMKLIILKIVGKLDLVPI
jgi:hypothetical protein